MSADGDTVRELIDWAEYHGEPSYRQLQDARAALARLEAADDTFHEIALARLEECEEQRMALYEVLSMIEVEGGLVGKLVPAATREQALAALAEEGLE